MIEPLNTIRGRREPDCDWMSPTVTQDPLGAKIKSDRSTVYVVDDDPDLLEELDTLLSEQGYDVKTFTNPSDFLALSKVNAPTCLILDLNLGGIDGFSVQRQIAGNAAMPIIFLSDSADIPATVRAIREGASEFLLKPLDKKGLIRAIHVALRQAKERWDHCQFIWHIRRCYNTLTRRERDVLPYVVRGFLNKQTAYELGVSEITVRIHRGQIMKKMRASSIADLVWLAGYLGIPDRSSTVEALMRVPAM
jgi:FixJ family two-component response regulator